MNTLDLDTLDNVTGGAVIRSSSNDAITQSLTSLQSTVSQLANNNTSSQSNMLLPMVMMMAMNRRQSTVVSPGAMVVG